MKNSSPVWQKFSKIRTNFNTDIGKKLKTLIGKQLKELIFYSPEPVALFRGTFLSRDEKILVGSRFALAIETPPLSRDERVWGILSFKSNNWTEDSYIVSNRCGSARWNLDFHFDKIVSDKRFDKIVADKIDDIELQEEVSKGRWQPKKSSVIIYGGNRLVNKIEVFGMKEYFEDIDKVDFENMPYESKFHSNQKIFKNYEYPIDINIITYVIVSLSEGTYLLITGGNNCICVSFMNEQEIKTKYQTIENIKNAFNRPFAKLIYTTDS